MQSNAAEKIEEPEVIETIEPDLSSTGIEDHEVVEEVETSNSPAPVPAGIKMLFAGVALIILFAILGFTVFSGDTHEPIVNDGYIDPVTLANGREIKNSLEDERKEAVKNLASVSDVKEQEVPSFDESLISNASVGIVDSDSTAPVGIDAELTKLKSILDEQGIDISHLSETLGRLKQEELGRLQEQMISISDDIKNIQSLVNKQYTDLKTAYKKSTYHSSRQPTKPPFNLVSIDVWGGKTSAVIMMQNKTSFAEVGEERAGWQIESINRPNCIVTRNTVSNKRTNVCMKG